METGEHFKCDKEGKTANLLVADAENETNSYIRNRYHNPPLKPNHMMQTPNQHERIRSVQKYTVKRFHRLMRLG